MNQRLRSDNFSTAETEVLLRLIRLNKDVIELKKSDRASCEVRHQKWEEICRLFNKHFGTARTAKSLKHKYDNHKRNRFKKKSMPQHVVLYNVSMGKGNQGLKDVLGDPLQGHFVDLDDHSMKSSPSATGGSTDNMPVEEITYVENIKEEMVEEDTDSWSNAAPSELTPSNPHPSRNSEDNSLPKRDGKLTQLVQEKLDYVKLQKQLLLEEYRLKLKHMKELHEKQVVDLDLSIELKRKQLSD